MQTRRINYEATDKLEVATLELKLCFLNLLEEINTTQHALKKFNQELKCAESELHDKTSG